MTDALIKKARTYITQVEMQSAGQREERQTEGRTLAEKLREAAVDLSFNKATEFSPDIPVLHLLAAKVALCAFGKYSSRLDLFEKDIAYYKNFPSTKTFFDEYENFKGSFT